MVSAWLESQARESMMKSSSVRRKDIIDAPTVLAAWKVA